MSRGIFGWSYPPGAENDPNAPWNQIDDEECEECGLNVDQCCCDDEEVKDERENTEG